MRNKILFVYGSYENIGIEYLSASLKKNGYKTDLMFFPMIFQDAMLDIDFLAKLFSYEDYIINSYDFSDVLFIAFNVPTDYYRYFLKIAYKIKRKEPDIPIVFGGIHPSSAPETVLEEKCGDYVAVGEGDSSIVEYAKYFEGSLKEIPLGLWRFDGKKIIKNGTGKFVKYLDFLPFPDKKLFYDKMPYLKSVYTIFTSRGCPYKCSYCINNFWYGKLYEDETRIRRRSVDNVIEELLEAKYEFNYKTIMFEDDIFVLRRDWHNEFVKKYKKYINKPFVCVLHPRYCQDLSVLKDLKRLGCIQVEIGIQTLNYKVRKKYLHRFETNAEIKKALENLHKSGLKFNIDHIAGLPGDSFKYHLKAVELYSKNRPNRVLYFFITNYPSTEIEDISLKENIVDEAEAQKMRKGFGNTDETTGSVPEKEAKKYESLRFLFGWLPLMPHKLVVFLTKTGFYKYIPTDRILTKIIPSVIATLTGGEPRGEIILKRYLIEIFSFKWVRKFYESFIGKPSGE
jgi:radical SAM superfamily enzyme YgiQ (UPF0313 family)